MRTIKQVARAAGVSVRALHHYDHIGLLTPDLGANGYRYYGEAELLRLQQILFYRELGLPLAEIARILDDPAFDTRAALVSLRQRIELEIGRHQEMASTIDRTLASLDAGRPVNERRLFSGSSAEKRGQWEAEISALYGEYGEAALADAVEAVATLSPAAFLDFKDEIAAIHKRFVLLVQSGASPASRAAQEVTREHFLWVCRSWRPDAQAYAALGRLYTEHADFREMYDALHPLLAGFLSEAMATYAETTLEKQQ
jgi:DNA-binding transcriptional MerR regulator